MSSSLQLHLMHVCMAGNANRKCTTWACLQVCANTVFCFSTTNQANPSWGWAQQKSGLEMRATDWINSTSCRKLLVTSMSQIKVQLKVSGRGWWASPGISRCRGRRQGLWGWWRWEGWAPSTLPATLISIVLLINVVWEDKNNRVCNCHIVSNSCPHHLNPLDVQLFKSCDIIFTSFHNRLLPKFSEASTCVSARLIFKKPAWDDEPQRKLLMHFDCESC